MPTFEVGDQVWERTDPLADPGTAPPIRGGTVVEVDEEGRRVRVVTGTPSRTSGKRVVRRITTTWLPFEVLDPALVTPRHARAHERARIARAIMRALSDRLGEPQDWDWCMLAWAVRLWAGPDNPGTVHPVGFTEEEEPC